MLELRNVQHRAALESFEIEGLTTTGRVSTAAKELRVMLGRAPRQETKQTKSVSNGEAATSQKAGASGETYLKDEGALS